MKTVVALKRMGLWPGSLFAGCLLIVWVASAVAQPAKSGAGSPLGVDVVSLKSGKSVRGAILRQEPNGSITMAVSREWFGLLNAWAGFPMASARGQPSN